jgi:hypothetical protein
MLPAPSIVTRRARGAVTSAQGGLLTFVTASQTIEATGQIGKAPLGRVTERR